MNLCFINHNYRYELEKLVRIFLPFEKIVFFEGEEQSEIYAVTELSSDGAKAYAKLHLNGKAFEKKLNIDLSADIIEKEEDIRTLRSMGATNNLIRRVFILEGWFISLAGLAAGLAAGVILSLIQQHFGIIKMPGHFLVQAYPIIISWADILMTCVAVASIGYLIAILPVLSRHRKWEE